jgi:hypothetical protein
MREAGDALGELRALRRLGDLREVRVVVEADREVLRGRRDRCAQRQIRQRRALAHRGGLPGDVGDGVGARREQRRDVAGRAVDRGERDDVVVDHDTRALAAAVVVADKPHRVSSAA